jgi:CBS domain containing-hemolysin-like protein
MSLNHLLENLLRLLLLAFFVGANGFFVAAEFALVKVRQSQLRPLERAGDWRARLALHISRNIHAYLSATQLGITLSTLGLGWLGEPWVAHHLRTFLEWLGLSRPAWAATLAYPLAFAIISLFQILLGELAPRSLAIQKPKKIALWVSAPLTIFFYALFPFIWLLNQASLRMLRLVGFSTTSSPEEPFTLEELQEVLAHAPHVHPADELIHKIMLKALRLRRITAEQIMVPKDQVVVLWTHLSVEENLKIAQRCGYSRFPVCSESKERVVGILLIQELLWQYLALGEQTELKPLLRPALTFLPKTQLPVMLELFRSSRNHLGIVVDPEDRMVGIVTLEDVLEELVGDIRDEFDIEKGPIFERTEEMALVDAEMPIRDLALDTGWPLPTDTAQTVEEWCLSLWGKRPSKWDTLTVDGFRITVEDASPQRLRRVRIERSPTDSFNSSDQP